MHNNARKINKQYDPEMKEIRLVVYFSLIVFFIGALIFADPSINILFPEFNIIPLAYAQQAEQISNVNATAWIENVLIKWTTSGANTTDYEISRGSEGWGVDGLTFVQAKNLVGDGSDGTALEDIFFKPDGLKMFIVDRDLPTPSIREYDLSIAWNVTSATFIQEFFTNTISGGLETSPFALQFSPNGTKMYYTGQNNDSIMEFTLSEAWNVTSATLINTEDISSTSVTTRGLWFKPDGTKLFTTEAIGDNLNEFSLSTPFDVSTLSFTQTFVLGGGDPEAIVVRDDGLKMWTGHVGVPDSIKEWNMSTAWDSSTTTFVQSYSLDPSVEDGISGIFVREDGLKAFITGTNLDNANEFNVNASLSVIVPSLLAANGNITTTAYLDTTVLNATLYQYGVKPIGVINGSIATSNFVTTANVPDTISNLTSNYATVTTIISDWDSLPDNNNAGSPLGLETSLTNYTIFIRNLGTPPYILDGITIPPSSDFTHIANFPDEKEIKVMACNQVGCGQNVTVTVLGFPLSTPVLSASNNIPLGINATWTNSITQGILQYSLFNSSDNITFTLLTTTANGTLFFFDTPHNICYEQYYKVRAETITQVGTNSSTALGIVNCAFTPSFATSVNIENIGDTFKIFGSGNFSGGNLTQIRLLENNTQTDIDITDINFTTGPDQVIPFSYLFWERDIIGGNRNFTVQVTGQSPIFKIESQSSSDIVTREYDPLHRDAIVESQGQVNFTHTRFNGQDNILLKVNRIGVPAGETWQIECIFQDVNDAIATKDSVVPEEPTVDWVGTWSNTTDTGYFNTTYTGASGGHIYISCFNDLLLFSTTSFTNSSLALFGIDAFDTSFGSLIGIPSGIFMLVLMAGMANKRTSPTWIVVITGAAGLMSVIGFFSLDPIVWGLALITAMLGMFVNQKVF